TPHACTAGTAIAAARASVPSPSASASSSAARAAGLTFTNSRRPPSVTQNVPAPEACRAESDGPSAAARRRASLMGEGNNVAPVAAGALEVAANPRVQRARAREMRQQVLHLVREHPPALQVDVLGVGRRERHRDQLEAGLLRRPA